MLSKRVLMFIADKSLNSCFVPSTADARFVGRRCQYSGINATHSHEFIAFLRFILNDRVWRRFKIEKFPTEETYK